jgi:hypothetical protein
MPSSTAADTVLAAIMAKTMSKEAYSCSCIEVEGYYS